MALVHEIKIDRLESACRVGLFWRDEGEPENVCLVSVLYKDAFDVTLTTVREHFSLMCLQEGIERRQFLKLWKAAVAAREMPAPVIV